MHPVLVSGAGVIVVVAVERRGHGEEILESDLLLDGRVMGERRKVAKVVESRRTDARNRAVGDRYAEGQRRDRLRRRARVVEHVWPTLAGIGLVDEFAVAD